MDNGFDPKIKHEIIVLSNLKNIKENLMIEYFGDKKNKYYSHFVFSQEEKTQEEEKEILEKKNKLKNESLELYYKKNSQKIKELESAFTQVKLKIKFSAIPKFLREGKLYTISKAGLILYESKLFNKLFEIKLEPSINIISVIQLDNSDLVCACFIKDKDKWIY